MSEWDPKRDLARIKRVEEWPLRPYLPVRKQLADEDVLTGFPPAKWRVSSTCRSMIRCAQVA
jgi:hypothetical protein